ncbi:hypothetical protein LAZ67_10001757 [Cordylochernes scorpioides]|uniref:DDE-1 domain-containing protein n=1 Tax=Cordylochernes scorpioides TaxID=51811 RepID=A0ABY6KZF8_9ARAC|nr:hypothetical protein LAZ67_10001757 [Cordylochernes scorpioides]
MPLQTMLVHLIIGWNFVQSSDENGKKQGFRRCGLYKKRIASTVLMEEYFEKCSTNVQRNGLVKKAVYMTAEAWTTLKDTTLAKSWNKLLPLEESISASEELRNSQIVSELAELITNSSCDVNDPGYQLLTDDEIIESVVDDQGSSDNKEELRDDDHVDKGPSNEEAFHCLGTAMKWLEQQEECNTVQLLSLKRLRDSATKNRTSALKQKKILDFFHELYFNGHFAGINLVSTF